MFTDEGPDAERDRTESDEARRLAADFSKRQQQLAADANYLEHPALRQASNVPVERVPRQSVCAAHVGGAFGRATGPAQGGVGGDAGAAGAQGELCRGRHPRPEHSQARTQPSSAAPDASSTPAQAHPQTVLYGR